MGQPKLLEVIRTLHAPRRFASCLNRWKEQAYQNTDNGDHDQQFNQRECTTSVAATKNEIHNSNLLC
jgi:hypothetical protein